MIRHSDIKYYDLENAINNLQLERYYKTKAVLYDFTVSTKGSVIAEVLRLLQYMRQNESYITANKVKEDLKCILSCTNMDAVRDRLDCLAELSFLDTDLRKDANGKKYTVYKPNISRESAIPVFMALYGTSTLKELFTPLNDILGYCKSMMTNMFMRSTIPPWSLGGLLSFSVECFGDPYTGYKSEDTYISVQRFSNMIQVARVALVNNVIKNNEKFLNCRLKDIDSVFAGTLNARINLARSFQGEMDYKLEGTTHIIGDYLYIDKEDNKHYDLIQ